MSIPSGLLAPLRRLSARNLPDECGIVRDGERTPNDSGGWVDGGPTTTSVACRLGPVSGRERVLGGRLVEESDAVITLPDDADVAGADRITHDGVTYEVVDVIERSQRLVQRVLVKATT